MADPLLQHRVGRQADGVTDLLRLQQLVQLGLGECRVAAEVEIEAALAIAGDHGLEHIPPAFCAVHVAGPQNAALEVAELVEARIRRALWSPGRSSASPRHSSGDTCADAASIRATKCPPLAVDTLAHLRV